MAMAENKESVAVLYRWLSGANPRASHEDAQDLYNLLANDVSGNGTLSVDESKRLTSVSPDLDSDKHAQLSQLGSHVFSCPSCKTRGLRVAECHRFRNIRCPNCNVVIKRPVNVCVLDLDTDNTRFPQYQACFQRTHDVNFVLSKSPIATLNYLFLSPNQIHRLIIFVDDFKDRLNDLGPLLQVHPCLKYIQLVLMYDEVEYSACKELQLKFDSGEERKRLRLVKDPISKALSRNFFLDMWDVYRREQIPMVFMMGIDMSKQAFEIEADNAVEEEECLDQRFCEHEPDEEEFCVNCAIC